MLKQWRSFYADKKSKRTATPPLPLPGITRCTTLKILGVTITNGLSMVEHYDPRRKIMFTNPPCTQESSVPTACPPLLFTKFSERWSLPNYAMHPVLGGVGGAENDGHEIAGHENDGPSSRA